MKFKLVPKIFSSNYIVLFLLLFISALMFRGRLGSDDLEVFNFVYNFKNFDGNISEFLNMLKEGKGSNEIIFSDDSQKHHYYTWHHRFVWVVQTYLIYNVIELVDFFFNFKTIFFHKYFSGYILSFYSVLSFVLLIKFFLKNKLSHYQGFFLSSLIFFSTGLITFFTGQYIESLAILLIILRFSNDDVKINFSLDLVLILIKPFYFIIIFFIRIRDFKYLEKNLIKENKKILIQIIYLVLIFIAIRFLLTDHKSNLEYIGSQNPIFNFENYFENLYNFYFAIGSGIIISSIPLIILIYIGRSKHTVLGILSVLALSLVISIYDASHGGVAGNRYFLPFLFIFINEFVSGFKIIVKKKNFLIYVLSVLTIINLPSIEYRNFIVNQYQNKSVLLKKPEAIAKVIEINGEKKMQLYEWPINNYKFNNIVFSNLILYSKVSKKEHVKISRNIVLETKYVFPQTGISRLIYLRSNNIKSGYEFIDSLSKEIVLILKIIYLSLIMFLLFFYINLIKRIIKN